MNQFWCFSAFWLWTGISSVQRSSDQLYPFTFCFKSEPAWTFSSICTIFRTADWSEVFSHSKWISRCDKATFFYFLDQDWFFQNIALWTNALTSRNGCAERMSRLSPKTLLWICFPVFLSQTCVEHFAPLCYLFVRHLLRKGLKTAKVCLFYLHASVSLGQLWTCCWFSRHPCQDHCWRYCLPHLGAASEIWSVGNAFPQSCRHH